MVQRKEYDTRMCSAWVGQQTFYGWVMYKRGSHHGCPTVVPRMFRVPRRIRGMRQELGSIFLRGKPEVEVAVVIDTPCLEAGA